MFSFITPLLKKSDLDQETLSSYRPISNLSVLSKIFERIFFPRIVTHLNNNNLLTFFQSAYRRHHSTKTALLKVFTDILEAADNKKISLLVLLDLSSAFDLIDHQILIRRLNESFGLNGLGITSSTAHSTTNAPKQNQHQTFTLLEYHKALFLDRFCSLYTQLIWKRLQLFTI